MTTGGWQGLFCRCDWRLRLWSTRPELKGVSGAAGGQREESPMQSGLSHGPGGSCGLIVDFHASVYEKVAQIVSERVETVTTSTLAQL